MTIPFAKQAATADNHDGVNDFESLCEQAVLQARRGHSARAMYFLQLALDEGECSPIEALILQGKIFVREGRLLDAESCWLKALKLDPANVPARAALERLRLERLPSWRINRLLWIFGLLFLLGGIVYVASELHDLQQAQTESGHRIEVLSESDQTLALAIKAQTEETEHNRAELQDAISNTRTALVSLSDRTETQRREDRDVILATIKSNTDSLAKESAAQLIKAQSDWDAELSKAQAELDADVKGISIREVQDNKEVVSRIDQSRSDLADILKEYRESLSALNQRVDSQMLIIKGDIELTREASDRIIWFRLPESKSARTSSQTGTPATQPEKSKAPAKGH